jgi:hypothetical protein
MKNGTGVKKAWQKPQLTIIVRGKSEEAVLLACKLDEPPHIGADMTDYRCLEPEFCGGCSLLSAS